MFKNFFDNCKYRKLQKDVAGLTARLDAHVGSEMNKTVAIDDQMVAMAECRKVHEAKATQGAQARKAAVAVSSAFLTNG